MLVLNMLYMTGSATRRFNPHHGAGSFMEDLVVVAPRAGCARKSSVNISAHVPGFMTSTARHLSVNCVHVFKPDKAGGDANAVDVYGVELHISPLLGLARSHPVLLQKR